MKASTSNCFEKKTGGVRQSLKDIVCYRCNQRGHMRRNCPVRNKAGSRGSGTGVDVGWLAPLERNASWEKRRRCLPPKDEPTGCLVLDIGATEGVGSFGALGALQDDRVNQGLPTIMEQEESVATRFRAGNGDMNAP